MFTSTAIEQGYYAEWIKRRFHDDPQLLKQQLYDLQWFRSTRHRPGSRWPHCRCLACQGLTILEHIHARVTTQLVQQDEVRKKIRHVLTTTKY